MRKADQSDIGDLLKVGQAISAEARPPMPFDTASRRQWLSTMLQRPDVLCLIEADDLGIEGMVMGAVQMQDGQMEAAVEYVWVHPDRRGSRMALVLMRVFQDWAVDMGAKVLYFSSSTGHCLDALARLVGAQEVGKIYRKALTNGANRPS